MKYNRTELAENIGFSTVTDGKFKTNSLRIHFITDLKKGVAADNAVGIGVLSTSSNQYNTLALLNEKLSALYGASLSSSVRKRGDIQILSLNASWINDRYAIDGEDITGEMLDIVCGCLFEPNAQNGSFDEESFDITKKDILDKIESEINNKRGYALSRASEVAYKGEPAENSCYDTKEAAIAVTRESSYEAYLKLLKTAHVEIFYVAPTETPQVEEKLKTRFSEISRKPISVSFSSPSPIKENVERASEEFEVNQCKMVMAFKTDSADTYALRLLAYIFGGTPVSKLFVNVREKLSLCYYCACRATTPKAALFVDCGVESTNLEKAEVEILRQLDEIRCGNFSDEEYNNALLSIDNSLAAVGDTPSSYISWYLERICEDNIITPQQQYELYKDVTRERIIAAANAVRLDSVYTMLSKEEAN